MKQLLKQTNFYLFAAVMSISTAVVFTAPTLAANNCGVETAIISCPDGVDNASGEVEETGVWVLLILAINILTGLVGLAAVAGVVYGAILYTSAGGSQEQVKKATTIFTNVAIGIIAYAGMYALLNYIIPGGVF